MSINLTNIRLKYGKFPLKHPVYANKISNHSLVITVWRFNLLKHTGHVMHQQFNIQQL